MKHFFLLFCCIMSFIVQAQFVPSVGASIAAVDAGIRDYTAIGSVYNVSNETYDYYYIHNTLGPLVGDVNLRGFGRNFLSDARFRPGYSLEIGLKQFRSEGIFVYNSSSTNDPDSILNRYDNFHFRTDYSMAYFKHYFDFNWNLNDKIKWTNSLGLGIMAMIRAKARDINDASIIDNDRPVVLNFAYQCQFTEKYELFDVGYYIAIDLFALSMFKEDEVFDPRIKLKDIRFGGFGFRLIPHPKKKKNGAEGIYESH